MTSSAATWLQGRCLQSTTDVVANTQPLQNIQYIYSQINTVSLVYNLQTDNFLLYIDAFDAPHSDHPY